MGKRSWVVTLKKEFHNTNENTLSLPKKIYDQYKGKKSTKLRFGQRTATVRVKSNRTADEVKISPTLISTLGFYEKMKCNLVIEEKCVRVGPLIGILVSNGYIKKLLHNQRPSFRSIEIEKANRKARAVIFCFSINDINFTKKTIQGIYYHPLLKKWKKGRFPFPDVINDRGSGRTSTKYKKYRVARRKLQKSPHIKLLNTAHYFDKWDLYKTLYDNHKDIRGYLPPTTLYSVGKLRRVMKGYRAIYIKSCIGSMGRRVMRLERKQGVGLVYSFYTKRLVRKRVKDIYAAHKVIRSFFGEDKIIMQRAIPLLQVNNRSIDMRATVQRNGKGKLEINSIAVRVGRSNSPVTSTRSGSNVYRLETFLKKYPSLLKVDRNRLKRQIEHFLLTIYKAIEKSYGGKFGEMGIDFGLDKKGRIWFIESNAKPAKDSLYRSYDRKTIQASFLNPLEYAKYIARF